MSGIRCARGRCCNSDHGTRRDDQRPPDSPVFRLELGHCRGFFAVLSTPCYACSRSLGERQKHDVSSTFQKEFSDGIHPILPDHSLAICSFLCVFHHGCLVGHHGSHALHYVRTQMGRQLTEVFVRGDSQCWHSSDCRTDCFPNLLLQLSGFFYLRVTPVREVWVSAGNNGVLHKTILKQKGLVRCRN